MVSKSVLGVPPRRVREPSRKKDAKVLEKGRPPGTILRAIFAQKSQKNEKKMNTAIGHCPGALQERKKNDF